MSDQTDGQYDNPDEFENLERRNIMSDKPWTMDDLITALNCHWYPAPSGNPGEDLREAIIDQLREADHHKRMLEQAHVQLAGCSAAALWRAKEPVEPYSYGWSPAYQDVLELRKKYEEQVKQVAALEMSIKGYASKVKDADALCAAIEATTGYEPLCTCPSCAEINKDIANYKREGKS